jgi:hypothetical protein
LAGYVQSVRDAASYLRIPHDEQTMVARIVSGLHPIQRVRFCFQALPTTFAQLEQLAVLDRSEMYLDQMRDSDSSSGIGSIQSGGT